MGCDIHMYVQYRKKDFDPKWESYWNEFGGHLNPGRDYSMFGILSDGVRSSWTKCHEPKGLPEGNLGWTAEREAYLYVKTDTNPYDDGYCTLEDAQRWGRKIELDKDGKPWRTIHPDWHSFSWLTTEEYAQALRWYSSQVRYKAGLEYRALLKLMKALEDNGKNDVRIVFWFDN
jgi:hypothetical protein